MRAEISLFARFDTLLGAKNSLLETRRELARNGCYHCLFSVPKRRLDLNRREFPVLFPVSREFLTETGSLETVSSSEESANYRFRSGRSPSMLRAFFTKKEVGRPL